MLAARVDGLLRMLARLADLGLSGLCLVRLRVAVADGRGAGLLLTGLARLLLRIGLLLGLSRVRRRCPWNCWSWYCCPGCWGYP